MSRLIAALSDDVGMSALAAVVTARAASGLPIKTYYERSDATLDYRCWIVEFDDAPLESQKGKER